MPGVCRMTTSGFFVFPRNILDSLRPSTKIVVSGHTPLNNLESVIPSAFAIRLCMAMVMFFSPRSTAPM